MCRRSVAIFGFPPGTPKNNEIHFFPQKAVPGSALSSMFVANVVFLDFFIDFLSIFGSFLDLNETPLNSFGGLFLVLFPKSLQEAPKSVQEASQTPQKASQEAPKTPLRPPERLPRRPQDSLRGFQDAPKTPQEAPKTLIYPH